ncbi:hypothetical protein F52700_9417 [Fusarium sp. NRRL 52700]|nr:hypothetical protein F52700_9417 [Fusarium sp. NRRL 52700]
MSQKIQIDSKAKALALGIYQETLDIHRIGVDVCKDVPIHEVIPVTMYQLCEAITTDIFSSVGIQKHEAEECFSAIARKISTTKILQYSKLESFEDVDFIRHKLSKIVRAQAMTEEIVCPPADIMGCVIAAIAYRKLQPTNGRVFGQNEDLVKLFGKLNGTQWLPIAIQVFHKTKLSPFVIELDETCQKPVAEQKFVASGPFWVVTTRMPDMNRYESILRNVLHHSGPSVQPSDPPAPKLEPNDNALPSVEPNETTNAPISISEDDDTENNTITLREYSRQMKSLGKRLPTRDRAIARRARREMMKKPGEAGEQEIEEVGPPKEYFDSYTHLKDVWKTCLQNQVSIPNSLRVLVDHHCTPSQVFHLTELEKEYLEEMQMEVDG